MQPKTERKSFMIRLAKRAFQEEINAIGVVGRARQGSNYCAGQSIKVR